jgi:serine/threonine-protein kinase HipA
LQRFGEDCAGALTISLQAEFVSSVNRRGSAEANVSFAAIERALNDGMPVQSVLRTGEDLPPFSLAGAQAKFPCIIRDHSILMPRSGEPTTHIVKLPIRAGSKWLDSVPNEFICMRLAAAVGLQVPNVMIIGAKIPLFAIERFDRKLSKAGPKRLHTQDFCQALGLPSSRKYEEHGGPSFADCFHLLAEESSNIARDQLALLDWLAFNLAIGNNDGHAKNLSLILRDSRIGLAPFYDIVCTAIYKQYSTQFAFKIGESRNWQKIRSSSIDTLARQMQVTPTLISSRWLEIFDKLENAIADLKAPQHFEKSISKTLAKVAKEVRMRLAELRKNITQRKT